MITEMITSGQKKQLLRVLEDGLDSAGLTKEQADEILKVGNLVQADLKFNLAKHGIVDKRFAPSLLELVVTVPSDYNHDTQIDTFAKKVKKEKTTYYYNDDFTSKHFANASTKLTSGKSYKVKFFPILATVQSEDCVSFLQKQNAILVGGQGLALLSEESKEKLPKGKWYVSFDKEEALWQDSDGDRGVPYVHAYTDGDFRWGLGYFSEGWDSDRVLVCFCDM